MTPPARRFSSSAIPLLLLPLLGAAATGRLAESVPVDTSGASCKGDQGHAHPELSDAAEKHQGARGESLMQSGRTVFKSGGARGLEDSFGGLEDEFDFVGGRHTAPAAGFADFTLDKISMTAVLTAVLSVLLTGLAANAVRLLFLQSPARSSASLPPPCFDIPLPGGEGGGPLWQAVHAGDVSRCAELLKMGSAVDQEDEYGCTPLHVAAAGGSATLAALLLEHHADVNRREAWDETPLHIAAREGNTEVCKTLLNHDAEIDAVNAHDRTPLVVAAHAGKEAVCELLLEHHGGVAGMSDVELPPLLSSLLVRRIIQAAPKGEEE